MHWREWVGTPTVDPVTGSLLGTTSDKEEIVRGLVHYVGAATAERRFAEVQEGDCIIDLPPAVVVSGRTGLEFEIRGELWEQKQIGDELSHVWDALYHGQPTLRTYLLTKKS